MLWDLNQAWLVEASRCSDVGTGPVAFGCNWCGSAVMRVARGFMIWGWSRRTKRAGACDAGARMRRTVGMEFDRVMGQPF